MRTPAFSPRGALMLRPFDETSDAKLASLYGVHYSALTLAILTTTALAFGVLGTVITQSPMWRAVAIAYILANTLTCTLEIRSNMPARALNQMVPAMFLFLIVVAVHP